MQCWPPKDKEFKSLIEPLPKKPAGTPARKSQPNILGDCKVPWLPGVISKTIFTSILPYSCDQIPNRNSLIIHAWRKALPHEEKVLPSIEYILVDPFSGQWAAPKMFSQWCDVIHANMMSDIDANKTRLAICHQDGQFYLSTSLKVSNYRDTIHPPTKLDYFSNQ